MRASSGAFITYLEQAGERGVLRLLCVPRVSPLRDCVSVVEHHREEGVEQQHAVGLHGGHVEERGLRRAAEGVRAEARLDHRHGVDDVLAQEHHRVEGRLVRRVVEHLHELRAREGVSACVGE